MSATIDCQTCGGLNDFSATDCEHCGEPVLGRLLRDLTGQIRSLLGPRFWTCKTCLVDTGDNVCPHCGRRLTDHDFDQETNERGDRQNVLGDTAPVASGGF